MLWFYFCIGAVFIQNINSQSCPLKNYGTDILTSALYWEFQYNVFCLDTMQEESDCNFQMAFCKEIDYGGQFSNCSSLRPTSVCQSKDPSTTGVGGYKIGAYTALNPFTDYGDLDDGFAAEFSGGQLFEDKNKLSLRVEFMCDPNAIWKPNPQDATAIPASAKLTARFNNATGQYSIRVMYAGACIGDDEEGGSGISAGSILLIIFFSLIAFYLLIGMVINAVTGERGPTVIPQYQMWKDLPQNFLYGINFSLAVILCRAPASAKAKEYDSID